VLAPVLAATLISASAVAQQPPQEPTNDSSAPKSAPTSAPAAEVGTDAATDPANPASQPDPARLRLGGAAQQEDDALTFRLRLGAGYGREAGLDLGGGFARGLTSSALESNFAIDKQWSLSASIAATRLFYAFDDQTTIVAGTSEPWDHANIFDLSLGAAYAIDQRRRLFTSLSVTSSGEEGADFGDTLTYGGVLGFVYSYSKKLTIGVGFAGESRLEDDAFALPFPIVQWGFAEQWEFYIGGSRLAGSPSAGVGVAYTPDPEVTVSLGVGGVGLGGEFRLDESGPIPGGVARDNFAQVIVGVDWRPSERVTVSAFAGATFLGELEVLDSAGQELYKSDVDAGPVFGLSIGIGF
jgi:hypothetical protein